jgi:hypothetical protein
MTATLPESARRTSWRLRGVGYEFCNCKPGCTCNFSGFPSSADGSCKAMVANVIREGRSGDVDLSGVTAVALLDWPRAIHDGNGRAVFVVTPETTDEQIGELANIYTGAYGGLPWEILGTTFSVKGLVKASITIEAEGLQATVRVDGVGEGHGDYFKNPVTGERHEAHIVLPDGFIWTKGECGVGSYRAAADELDLSFQDTNWILYDFDWSNA